MYYTLWWHKPKHPKKPQLPDQFKSHSELFRSYLCRLKNYYFWRSKSYTMMFSEGMGSFGHLFLIAGVELPYLAFITACYHLGIDGSSFTRKQLNVITNITPRMVDHYRMMAFKRGHLRIFKTGRYVITSNYHLCTTLHGGTRPNTQRNQNSLISSNHILSCFVLILAGSRSTISGVLRLTR